jgi:DNA-binding transcriptional regulator YiaG
MKAATKKISETKEVAMSDILKSVHKTAKGLKKAGAIDKATMRQFDTLCSNVKLYKPYCEKVGAGRK